MSIHLAISNHIIQAKDSIRYITYAAMYILGQKRMFLIFEYPLFFIFECLNAEHPHSN